MFLDERTGKPGTTHVRAGVLGGTNAMGEIVLIGPLSSLLRNPSHGGPGAQAIVEKSKSRFNTERDYDRDCGLK